MTGGRHCQREREKERVPVRGIPGWAVGLNRDWAERDASASFRFFCVLQFSLFYFLFLFDLFITFAFWLQMNSTQILKFSNIQNNILTNMFS
jgi:hypothetical protein